MIAITGHTQGLGAALIKRFADRSMGFSRSNGYDITSPKDRVRITDAAKDCDVFINNAYAGMAQVDLLYDIWTAWQGTDKLIINISSNSADGIKRYPHIYAVHKAALDKACEQLANQDGKLRVCNVRPGWIDTERAASHQGSKISLDDMVRIVEGIMHAPPSLQITAVTVLPR